MGGIGPDDKDDIQDNDFLSGRKAEDSGGVVGKTDDHDPAFDHLSGDEDDAEAPRPER